CDFGPYCHSSRGGGNRCRLIRLLCRANGTRVARTGRDRRRPLGWRPATKATTGPGMCHLASLGVSLVLAAAACSSRGRDAAPETAVTLNPDAGSWSLPGTLRIPEAAGGIACVVFFAGSGPTDRDWLSPLLPGTNGSGRQLAEGLAAKGIGSLRFDKVGSGKNMEHLEVLSLEHYVEEAALAFDFLAARPECTRVFLLGHSEGVFHATGAALARQSSPSFGGLVLLAGAS